MQLATELVPEPLALQVTVLASEVLKINQLKYFEASSNLAIIVTDPFGLAQLAYHPRIS